MRMSATRAAAACALLTTTCLTAAALAQTGPNPPPRQDTQSPTGVSLSSGAFSHQERDLAIGGAGFPHGLSLERSYLSSLDDAISQRSGTPTQGWTNNLNARVGNSLVPVEFQQPPQGQETYLYSVTIGSRSIGFTGGTVQPTGGFPGSYEPVNLGGEILEFSGDHSTGHYTFTDSDGTVIEFNPQNPPGRAAMSIASWTAPDGTRLDYSYDSDGLRSVFSNRGYALLFEYGNVAGGRARTKACAVNLTTTYVTATSACPAGAQTVTYQYSAGSLTPMLSSATNAAGGTTTYSYTSRGHLGCITLPGQSGCQIANSYGLCTAPVNPDEPPQAEPASTRWHEPVLSQVTATGETYSYNFPATQECPGPPQGLTVAMTVSGTLPTPLAATTTVTTNEESVPTTVTDPLQRTTQFTYTGRMNWTIAGGGPATLASVTRPEGNRALYDYDERGNVEEERVQAKAGSGLADIVRTAHFPAACTNRRTCNRPGYVVDARGARTDFTYDPAHGGVLTETGPAVNGIRPQVRYAYAQRHAWIRNSSGGYSQAATPVWLRTSESRCRTSAATGNPAAPCVTAGDETVTTFDYGPDGGPNNLLLRGTVVDATGQALRSCVSYDANGNRLSETSPRAGLSSCQ